MPTDFSCDCNNIRCNQIREFERAYLAKGIPKHKAWELARKKFYRKIFRKRNR